MSTSESRKLLDETREIMRLHHYSIHTERVYCGWIKRYVRYHGMTCRDDLKDGETKIEAFLTHALNRKYPGAGREWGWQYVFPSRTMGTDPRGGIVRRHHIDPR